MNTGLSLANATAEQQIHIYFVVYRNMITKTNYRDASVNQLYYIGMINCNSDNYMSIWPISKRAWRALLRGAFIL